jgi:hypothetical protein
VFLYGEPISVRFDADRQAMEEKRRELQSALDRLTAEAESLAQAGDRAGVAPGGLR